mgnify:CR=1 FL=1
MTRLTGLWTFSLLTLSPLLLSAGCGDDDGFVPDDAGDLADAAAPDASADDAGVDDRRFAALVRGTLFTDDLAMAQARHDMLAAGGESAARDAGDTGHDAMLGTTLLGTTENAFVGLDQWNSLMGMTTFYDNPDFAAAFGMLFDGAPNLEFFQTAGFHEWGDLASGDAGGDHVFVVVRGRLAEADLDAARMAHDAVAAGGEEMVRAAGDVAHVAFVGLTDTQEFFAIDIWNDTTNLEAVYTDPDFQAAFGSLFSAPPTIAVHASTEWHQW